MQGSVARPTGSRRRPRLARAALAGAVGAAALGLAPAAMAASGATLMVNPRTPDIVKASTFTGTFILKNESSPGVKITKLQIDLRDGPALFYDFAFDPVDGTPAGDTNGKGFEFIPPNHFGPGTGSDSGVGAENPRYLVPEGGGFAVLEVEPTNLDPGEELQFAIDIDPTSTQGTTGHPPPHQASVSGAELHGAKVTVSFSDGSTQTTDVGRDPGSNWKGTATLKGGLPGPVAIARPNNAVSPAKVPTVGQSVVVSGPAGAQGVVLVSEGQLIVTGAPNGGFDLDPFEANMAVKFTEVPFTLGQNGAAVVPVTLTDSAPLLDPEQDPVAPFQPKDRGLNYITAYLLNEIGPGPVTQPIVLQHDPNVTVDTDPPAISAISPADGAAGVAADANVTVTFDEAMSSAAVAGALKLVDEAGATVPATVSGSGTGFTLDPAAALAAGKRYTASVAASAADTSGNPLPAARSWSFTVAGIACTGRSCDGVQPPPPPNPNDPWCAVVPERPKSTGNGTAKIRLEASQLLISQRIAQAAVRRANAIEAWLAAGLVENDFCGNAFGREDFGAGVTLADGTSVAASTPADPRPIVVEPGKSGGTAARVQLEAGQLLINQRISQAAVRRVNALAARLEAGLTGGDIRDGAITGAKLKRNLVIAAAPGGPATPASVTRLGGRGGGGGQVSVSVKQLQINQRISQAAVRRVNELVDRLMRGLTGADFRDGTVGAADLAPGLRPGA